MILGDVMQSCTVCYHDFLVIEFSSLDDRRHQVFIIARGKVALLRVC